MLKKSSSNGRQAEILTVDFKERKLIGHESIPKRSVWQCDCCGSRFTSIDGADNNQPYLDIEKVVKLNKQEYAVKTRICKDCGIKIGDMFKEEN